MAECTAKNVDIDTLREMLAYDPETGHLTWKVTRGRAVAGMRIGVPRSHSCPRVKISRSRFYGHELAFVFMTGALPPRAVVHINGDRADNRWSNLRLVDPSDSAPKPKPKPVVKAAGWDTSLSASMLSMPLRSAA